MPGKPANMLVECVGAAHTYGTGRRRWSRSTA